MALLLAAAAFAAWVAIRRWATTAALRIQPRAPRPRGPGIKATFTQRSVFGVPGRRPAVLEAYGAPAPCTGADPRCRCALRARHLRHGPITERISSRPESRADPAGRTGSPGRSAPLRLRFRLGGTLRAQRIGGRSSSAVGWASRIELWSPPRARCERPGTAGDAHLQGRTLTILVEDRGPGTPADDPFVQAAPTLTAASVPEPGIQNSGTRLPSPQMAAPARQGRGGRSSEVFAYTRKSNGWAYQATLAGSEQSGEPTRQQHRALRDGDTAIVGGFGDNKERGRLDLHARGVHLDAAGAEAHRSCEGSREEKGRFGAAWRSPRRDTAIVGAQDSGGGEGAWVSPVRASMETTGPNCGPSGPPARKNRARRERRPVR